MLLKSPMVGASYDEAKTWRFLDISPGEEKVRKMVPEIPKSLKFPADEDPQPDPGQPAG
jgi:hypothetical protein